MNPNAAIPAPIKLHVTGEASPAKEGLPLSLTVRSPGFSQDALTLSNVDVELAGAAVDYTLKARTHLKVDKITEGDLTVEGKGTELAASLTALTLATDRGTAVFSGDVDLLVNLRDSGDFTGDFISKVSKAKFKIGVCPYPGNPFDLTVTGKEPAPETVPDGTTPPETRGNTDEKIDAIYNFLKQIV